MHLRMPSIDRGVQSFIWAVVFFLFLYFGMLAIAISKGTAFVLSLVLSFLMFLFVRTRGDEPARTGLSAGWGRLRGLAALRGEAAQQLLRELWTERFLEPHLRGRPVLHRLPEREAIAQQVQVARHACPWACGRRLSILEDRPTRAPPVIPPGRERLSSPIEVEPPLVEGPRGELGAELRRSCGARPPRTRGSRPRRVASEWYGTSTWDAVTRFIEVEPQAGQRTATARPAHGTSSRKADGVTGLGASSR